MLYVVSAIVVVAAFFFGGVVLRPAPLASPAPKPFGLKAFEAHSLATASDDVLKAVVATISFLGHPFVVVEEAKEEMSRAYARETQDRRQIAENMEKIKQLQEDSRGLDADAFIARSRASQMDEIVGQVNSVAGS